MISSLIDQFVYRPDATMAPGDLTPADLSLAYEDVTLQTNDGVTLWAWYLPSPQPKCALMYCHGNAGDIRDWVHAAPPWSSTAGATPWFPSSTDSASTRPCPAPKPYASLKAPVTMTWPLLPSTTAPSRPSSTTRWLIQRQRPMAETIKKEAATSLQAHDNSVTPSPLHPLTLSLSKE